MKLSDINELTHDFINGVSHYFRHVLMIATFMFSWYYPYDYMFGKLIVLAVSIKKELLFMIPLLYLMNAYTNGLWGLIYTSTIIDGRFAKNMICLLISLTIKINVFLISRICSSNIFYCVADSVVRFCRSVYGAR